MQPQEVQAPQQQAKQNNQIRKAAIQAFQPVITKIQQHIAYLLAETAKLRQKNELLQKTTADHNVIMKAITDIREDMHKINMNILDQNKKIETNNATAIGQFFDINLQITQIRQQLKQKQKSITKLFDKNEENKNKLQTTTDDFKDIVSRYASQVAVLSSDNKSINHNFKILRDNVNTTLENLQTKIVERDQLIQNSTQKLQMYLSERQELRRMVSQMYNKVQKSVDLDKYEHDWRIIRMENQSTRKQNKKMIDQALTPQVRKFLPEMMQRIQQVRKVNVLQIVLNQQKIKLQLSQMSHKQLEKQLGSAQKRLQLLHEQLKRQSEKIIQSFSQKFKQGNQTANQALSTIQTQTTQLVLTKQKQIRHEIANLIDNNKDAIYNHVLNLIPQEEKDFYNKMKDFLPLLQSTKKDILSRCDQITEFGQKLQQKLQNFNNKIVKIKGDVTVQVDNLKKKNKLIDNSILIIAQNFKQVGKVISTYCELLLLSYSLSFDTFDQEVYVTHSDGIIYEYCNNQNQVSYRKMKATKSEFRRSALSSLVKLTDWLITNQQYSFLSISEFKPSEHFKLIKEQIILSAASQIKPISRRKQRRPSATRIKQKSLDNKLPSIDYNPSKTIDFSSIAEPTRESPSSTLTNIQTQQRKERAYKGRYSQMK